MCAGPCPREMLLPLALGGSQLSPLSVGDQGEAVPRVQHAEQSAGVASFTQPNPRFNGTKFISRTPLRSTSICKAPVSASFVPSNKSTPAP